MTKVFSDLSKKNDSSELEEILKAIKGLQYGNVTLVIQDSKIVQIHKTEKTKLKK